ncbi:tRNA N(3)-methylcytidine methyltransferase METTL6 [Leptopilina boulardi]|uniref:tRNA N(3)-methylcytidine methyltransferase METTL6 n=1 Tax=Leptopilina boulardi TaxID=63433 RepID=UPI0021F64916|nr:tRNA N(3)-methylcytidine methyltransferase METTL6 [Leptopilina boulardi]
MADFPQSDHVVKRLTSQEIEKLDAQNSRIISQFRAKQLEKDAKKYWDLFYKRNETRFFKDRHWTTREFQELLDIDDSKEQILMEVGCGVGNFIYPLIEDGINVKKIFACDLSPRAIEFVKMHNLYDPQKIEAFQADVTLEKCFSNIDIPIDIATLIFVLSAVHPDKFKRVAENLFDKLNNGGMILFRDYGLYDMAQLRFKAGHKIAENFYMRQDGTRSYYFSIEEIKNLFESSGFETVSCSYIHRRTINLKENIDVPRIFVQAKFKKP